MNLCQISTEQLSAELWRHTCSACGATADLATPRWFRKCKIRGLGDVVAKVTGALGIPECGGCAKRREALNRLIPL